MLRHILAEARENLSNLQLVQDGSLASLELGCDSPLHVACGFRNKSSLESV